MERNIFYILQMVTPDLVTRTPDIVTLTPDLVKNTPDTVTQTTDLVTQDNRSSDMSDQLAQVIHSDTNNKLVTLITDSVTYNRPSDTT